MSSPVIRFFTIFSILALSVLGPVSVSNSYANESAFQDIEWIELIPKDDLDALMNPPDYMSSIQDGSAQDTLETLDQWGETNEAAKRYKEALESAEVVSKYDGKSIRIPGFVVPLDTNEDREVTSFFIVPYFGACLHLPPPPPNQIIYGEWAKGLTVEELSIPMWFEGTLGIQTNENEMGTSAYKLDLANVSVYEE
jgi:hypothetical protein